MYANLKMEMGLKGVTIEEIAKTLEIHRNSASFKINGEGSFTIDEAFKVHKKHFAYADMQYLFKKLIEDPRKKTTNKTISQTNRRSQKQCERGE